MVHSGVCTSPLIPLRSGLSPRFFVWKEKYSMSRHFFLTVCGHKLLVFKEEHFPQAPPFPRRDSFGGRGIKGNVKKILHCKRLTIITETNEMLPYPKIPLLQHSNTLFLPCSSYFDGLIISIQIILPNSSADAFALIENQRIFSRSSASKNGGKETLENRNGFHG